MLGSRSVKSTRRLVLCINYIIHVFSAGKRLIITLGDEHYEDFPVMRMTTEGANRPQIFPKPSFFILNIENRDINEVILFVEKMGYDRNTRFILIAEHVTKQDLEELASNYITRMVLLNPTTGFLSTVKPYQNRMLKNVDTTLKPLGYCTEISSVGDTECEHRQNHGLFCDGTPKTWTNSVITVRYHVNPPYTICARCKNQGVEFEAHFMIMELLNLTGRYVKREVRAFDAKTAREILMEEMAAEKQDVLLNTYPFHGMDYTATFVHDHYSWFVAAPSELPRWKYTCIMFTVFTWILLVFSMVSISVVWYFINFFLYKERRLVHILRNLVVVLRLTVEQGHNLNICHYHQLILYLSISIFVFIWTLVYKTQYTNVLTKNIFEEGINSLEDAIDNKLYVGLPVFRKSLWPETPEAQDYLNKYFIPCNFSNVCLERAARERDMITPTIDRRFNYLRRRFMDKDGRTILKKLHPPLLHLQLVQVLHRGHVLTPLFSKYLGYIRAHGFMNYLMNKYDYQALVPPVMKSRVVKLTFEHVQAPVGLLAVGLFVGIGVFLFELRYH